MIRNLSLLWVLALSIGGVNATDFTATYTRLADSPLGVATTWYSGAVTNDGKFVYGMGHSHSTINNNSLWSYDPVTNTHNNLFPNTGNKWKWVNDPVTGKPVSQSGYWDKLDPVADKTLYTYFGGPDIFGLNNRNNHQAFYLPARNEFWIAAGANWDHGGNLWGGRFNLSTSRYNNVSKSPTEFFAGTIAGTPGWVAANAATAVCKDLNTVVMFGGMGNKTGSVRLIEPNPTGTEPYKWNAAPAPPIFEGGTHSVENVRHMAVCVGDTVYFGSGQEGWPNGVIKTPVPGQFWKFHVPTRKWARLTDGPPGGYFPTLTHDSDNQVLLYYGGGTGKGSDALWVYDLADSTWHDLTGTTTAPKVDHHSGGFVPGFGHVFKGGRQFTATGVQMDYGVSRYMHRIVLTGGQPAPPPVVTQPPPVVTQPPPTTDPAPAPAPAPAPTLPQCPVGCVPVVSQPAPPPVVTQPPPVVTQPPVEPPPVVVPTAGFTWTKIPLPGSPNSPQGSMKHQRLAEGPNGRVYLLAGDWGGGDYFNTGRQEVYSFDPNSLTGDWKLEAPYCGTVTSPVHWHTDEAGVAWDEKRKVFWKLAGIPYGTDDACFLAGKSVKAKVIQFDPATKLWTVPPHVEQKSFGYVTNGVLDPVKDEMIQIVDKAAFHLNLETGKWTSYPLPGDVKRFTALTTRIGRVVWFGNQKQFIESYNLDTHTLTNHGNPPWPTTFSYITFMTAGVGERLLVIKATSGPTQEKHAALYDPATRKWTVLDQGEAFGNTMMMTSDGRLILMGGGINGPADHNKQVWVGTPQ